MSYRTRQLRGLMVPSDERVALPKVTTQSLQQWLTQADMDYLEIVSGTIHAREHGFCMLVDDDGHSRRLPWNPRAQFLSGYSLASPILGNALFFSFGWVNQGHDPIDLKPEAAEWLTSPDRLADYQDWLGHNRADASRYSMIHGL